MNKAEYGQGYYQQHLKNMKQGYVHPYHTEDSPLVWSKVKYMKVFLDLVGPEQVSPHYETLSKSRKGLIFLFLYTGAMYTIAQMGGWAHNEWMRNLVFSQEFIICFFLSQMETKHFFYFIGPKFSLFYQTYSQYEVKQLFLEWNDSRE